MLTHKTQSLVDAIPRDFDVANAGRAMKQAARAVLAEPERAIELLDAVGGVDAQNGAKERLVTLLSASLDEARMAHENGKKSGTAFLVALEDRIGGLKADGKLSDGGRLLLVSCWIRAGLDAPEILASDFDMPDDFGEREDIPDLSDAPDIGPVLDKLLSKISGGQSESLHDLHAGFSELISTVPAPVRRAIVRLVAMRPKAIFGELGCALLLDRRKEVRRGAIEGLSDRLNAKAMTLDMIGKLTIMRSWNADVDVISGIDALVRDAMRQGIGGSAPRSALKVHRAFTSMLDGTGSQSMAVAVQAGAVRSVVVLLIKQGFGVKDAYVVPCSSASEQRRLLDMIASQVDTRDVSLDYIEQALALGLSDGLQSGHPPAPGLVDSVQTLGFSELRPKPASVADIVALVDPDGDVAAMSPQAFGRLINASGDWGAHFPMIVESWFEDSDTFTDAIIGSSTPTAMKRSLWRALEERREYWAHLIARMALLLHANEEPEAKEFVAVAAALVGGRPLKKLPVMDLVFNLSLGAWAHGAASQGGYESEGRSGAFEITSGPVPAGTPIKKPAEEKPGELTKLLQPAGLTEWWVDGYMMGVCTAPSFVPPGSWANVLLNIISSEIKEDAKLQRLLDLLMLHYNGTLVKLRTPIGVLLVPKDETPISIWADGFLTAWEGNLKYWPKAKLGKEDKQARKMLEDAASWRADLPSFAKTIPNWLRHRFAAQIGNY
jgi:hypothetical protein